MKNRIKKIMINAVLFFSCLLFGTMGSKETIKAYEVSGFYQYEIIDDVSVRITKYTGGEVTVNIPSELGGKEVTEIGDDAFREGLMTYVNIPDTVISIGSGAFYNCDSLKEITIPDNVIEIASGGNHGWLLYETFGYCDNLEKVVIGKGVREIGEYCFRECEKLKTVSVSNKAKFNIGEGTFMDCKQLESINIPRTISEIGDKAFYNCISLTDLILNEGLEYIGAGAFYNCDSLKEITIPDSVIEIASDSNHGWLLYETFGYCDNLKSVIIGKNTSFIGDACFVKCKELEKVIIPKSVTEIGRAILYGSEKAVIYGFSGTAAQAYANENEIHFVEMLDVPMTAISFDVSEAYMIAGETFMPAMQISPINTTDGIQWQSSDENIAVVNNSGKVTAKKEGSVTIIATSTNDIRASYNVVVSKAPEYLTFNLIEKEATVGDTFKNVATVDDGRTDIAITYKSSDESVAIVNKNGKVEVLSEGECDIIAEIQGGLTASYKITVKSEKDIGTQSNSSINKKQKLKLNSTKAVVKKGKRIHIKAVVMPSVKIQYSSSNKKIAAVNSKGVVKAKRKGKAVIFVKANGVTKKFKVTVK